MKQKNRLMELRKEKGFTRDSFAKHLGIPFSTLRNYELSINEPREEFLISISQYFDVSLDYLLGISDEKTPYNTVSSTSDAENLLNKYHKLDPHGKELVNLIIDKEFLRCTSVPYYQLNVTIPSDHKTKS